MPAKKTINLLPPDLVGGGIKRAMLVVKSLAISLSAGLLVLVSLGFVAIFLFSNRLSDLNDRQAELRDSIRNLEQTESGMVLTRQRLEMVDRVLSTREIEDRFDKQNTVLALSREGIAFRESNIEQADSSLVIESSSSRALSDLFDNFFVNERFDRLYLNSLIFDPFTGYRVDLGVF